MFWLRARVVVGVLFLFLCFKAPFVYVLYNLECSCGVFIF